MVMGQNHYNHKEVYASEKVNKNKEKEDIRNEAVVLDFQVIKTVAKMIKGNLKPLYFFLGFPFSEKKILDVFQLL